MSDLIENKSIVKISNLSDLSNLVDSFVSTVGLYSPKLIETNISNGKQYTISYPYDISREYSLTSSTDGVNFSKNGISNNIYTTNLYGENEKTVFIKLNFPQNGSYVEEETITEYNLKLEYLTHDKLPELSLHFTETDDYVTYFIDDSNYISNVNNMSYTLKYSTNGSTWQNYTSDGCKFLKISGLKFYAKAIDVSVHGYIGTVDSKTYTVASIPKISVDYVSGGKKFSITNTGVITKYYFSDNPSLSFNENDFIKVSNNIDIREIGYSYFINEDSLCNIKISPYIKHEINTLPYLTLKNKSNSSFDLIIHIKKSWNTYYPWDGTLQYSLDNINWTNVNKNKEDTTISSNSNGYLYLRGINNTYFSYKHGDDCNYIYTDTPIYVYGDLNNILDYNNNNIVTGKNGFAGLFEDMDIITAPYLGTKNSTEYCYYNTFKNCTSLTEAPPLKMESSKEYCFSSMFEQCSNLKVLSYIYVNGSLYNCDFNYMFKGCKSLYLSTVQTSTYKYEYRIPKEGNMTSSKSNISYNHFYEMFSNIGGPSKDGVPSNASPNTVYYTNYRPIG